MNISLPDTMRRYVEERVREGDYGNTSEFIRDLIRRDREERKRAAEVWLAQELLPAIEGIERGEFHEGTPEFWSDLRREVSERLASTSQPRTQE